MAYEPRRTLLVGLSALAVVLVAALFPAAGVGSHPAGSAGIGAPGGSTVVDTPEMTPTPEVDPTPTDVRDDTNEDERTEVDDETPTEPPVDRSGDGGGPWLEGLTLMGLLMGALKLLAVGSVGAALLGVVVVLAGAEPGTPEVELPFGITVTLPFVVPEWAGNFGTRVSRLTMGFVVSVSASVTQLLDASAAAFAAVAGGLGIALGEGFRGVFKLFAALPRALAGALGGLATLPAAVLSLPSTLSTVGGTVSGASERPDGDARELAPDPVEADEPGDAGPTSVEDAWVAMVEALPIERSPSTTPAEYARSAVERGFPAGPIGRVTRAFEDVVYGGHEADDRASVARSALSSLRDRLGGDGQ